MSNKIFRCPKCSAKVTQNVVQENGHAALWWHCPNGHFFGSPYYYEEWENPDAAPADPVLDPWPDDVPKLLLAAERLIGTLKMGLEPKPSLTFWQFLLRAVPAVFLAFISVILAAEILVGPYVKRQLNTLI